MGTDKRKQLEREREASEASEARALAEREASAAAREREPSTPMSDSSSDDESTSTTANTVTSDVEKLIQTYHNSWAAEEKNGSLADILYAAGHEVCANSSTTDWRLQHVIQAVTAVLKDVNTCTTTEENGSHWEASNSPFLRRLNQYSKWNSEFCSWRPWYQGLSRAYHDDCAGDLDPTNHTHALAAWNAILDKLPPHVLVTLMSEKRLDPERPDPSSLLTALDGYFDLGM
ncbi:hypothetical protein QR685DRAFT_517945 [Neurospora intermedia]|uniref:Uncharacterized protein n=1 Tax=Neurospora intermedia TaxID=5142 RepID=A0ABR3DMF0_NEUIN